MDKTLAGFPHTIAYLDDILVASVNQANHNANFCTVSVRLRTAGFKLNTSKSTFNKLPVTYLAHHIDSEGLHLIEDKVRTIMDANTMRDVVFLSGAYHVLFQIPGKSLQCVSTIE